MAYPVPIYLALSVGLAMITALPVSVDGRENANAGHDAYLTAPLSEITGFSPPANLAHIVEQQKNESPRRQSRADNLRIEKLKALSRPESVQTFGKLSAEIQKRLLGERSLLVAVPYLLKYKAPAPLIKASDSQVDFTKLNVVTPVKDQNSPHPCPSCWAFATIAAFESNWAIQNRGKQIDASEQDLLDCSGPRNCQTGFWAFQYILSAGVARTTDLKYNAVVMPCNPPPKKTYRAVNWNFVDPNKPMPDVNAIKQAMAEHGPVAAGIAVDESFRRAPRGKVWSRESGRPPNHAILIVGWNDNMEGGGAWLIKNSWGIDWCDSGYAWIKWGCCKVGFAAAWVTAQSIALPIPAAIY
jgi:C1A family cysteine protease